MAGGIEYLNNQNSLKKEFVILAISTFLKNKMKGNILHFALEYTGYNKYLSFLTTDILTLKLYRFLPE